MKEIVDNTCNTFILLCMCILLVYSRYNYCTKMHGIESSMLIKMSSSLHIKCPLFLSDCNGILIFSTVFRKKFQISSLSKICSERDEFFHADRQTEGRGDGRTNGRTYRHDEANSNFSEFCEHA
jgi:hypothetical protein